jgi:hypothetical protein
MLVKMRCRVCDAEGFVNEAAAEGEIVCERCAASYEALLAELTSKAQKDSGQAPTATDAIVPAEADAPDAHALAEQAAVVSEDLTGVQGAEAHAVQEAHAGETTELARPRAEALAARRNETAAAPVTSVTAAGVSMYRVRPASLAAGAVCLLLVVGLLSWFKPAGNAEAVAATQFDAAAPAAQQQPESHVVASHGPEKSADELSAEEAAQAAADVADEEPIGQDESAPTGVMEEAAKPEVKTVEPTAVASNPTPAPAETGYARGSFTVQTGSFNNPSEANESANALRAAGFVARVASADIPKKGTWHRVQSGSFPTREEAARYEQRVRASGASASTLVTQIQD